MRQSSPVSADAVVEVPSSCVFNMQLPCVSAADVCLFKKPNYSYQNIPHNSWWLKKNQIKKITA